MKSLTHLRLQEIKLPPGEEWTQSAQLWRFLRVHSGAAYWLGAKENRPLAEGEVLIAAPAVRGIVRASQLGEVVLHGFAFEPELLYGFFTMTERAQLETAASGARQLRFLPSTHPVAQNFAVLASQGDAENSPAQRVLALGLVTTVFQDELIQTRQDTAVLSTSALHRFEQIIVRMPDTELAHHSPEELARLCGCSPRHFNRLFRLRFGRSARERQTELRLLKARQLLSEKNDKIIHLALEAGYQNLSLFNTLFKKRFGLTPSQWRSKTNKSYAKARVLAAALLVWLAAAMVVHGQETNATPQANPAPAAAAKPGEGRTFSVTSYELDGNTLLPPEAYEAILQDHVGEAISFETIRACIANLTIAYRVRGYSTVALSLPPQQLTNGVVKIKVTEGKIYAVKVTGNRFFSVRNVLRTLPSLHTNEVLNSILLQAELDRANGNRDRQIYPVVAPGPEPGTSVLELRVKDQLPLHARFEFNNYNTPNSPELRMNLSGSYDNLWQLEHQIGVQYSFTPQQLKKDHYDYFPDAPLIANYSAFYRFPLGPVNGGSRESAESSGNFGYDEATHKFNLPPNTRRPELNIYVSRSSSDSDRNLSQSTDTPSVLPSSGGLQVSDKLYDRSVSITENLGVRLSEPLPKFWGIQSSISAGVDYKSYETTSIQDRIFGATVFVPEFGDSGPPFVEYPSPPISSTRTSGGGVHYLPAALNFDANRPDDNGTTSFNLYQSYGLSDSIPHYYVLNSGLTREQKIEGDWGVRFQAGGQWTDKPLFNNEQFGLGGQGSVRGYYEGEQYGDTGWRVSIEPHTPQFELGLVDGTEPMLARLYGFFDYGQRYLLGNGFVYNASAGYSSKQPRSADLAGTGGGISATIGDNIDLSLQVAFALLDTPTLRYTELPRNPIRAGDMRISFCIGARF